MCQPQPRTPAQPTPIHPLLLLLQIPLTTAPSSPPSQISQNHRLLFLPPPPASPCTPPRLCTTLSAASSTSPSTPSPVMAEHSAYRSTPTRFACQIACLIPFSVCIILSSWGGGREGRTSVGHTQQLARATVAAGEGAAARWSATAHPSLRSFLVPTRWTRGAYGWSLVKPLSKMCCHWDASQPAISSNFEGDHDNAPIAARSTWISCP